MTLRYKYRQLLFFLAILQIPIFAQSQPFLQKPKDAEVPPLIRSQLVGAILQCQSIDFDGDKEADYLVVVKNDSASDPYSYEYWFNSHYHLLKRIPKYIEDDYDYLWFVNLDDDPEPAIVTANGSSDGIDYSIYKQDLHRGKDSLLLRFNPILIDSTNKLKEYYLGYPWDISDIVLARDSNRTLIHCSVDHDIERDGVIDFPDWQTTLPVILFTGKTTQPEIEVEEIRKLEWLKIDELVKKIHKWTEAFIRRKLIPIENIET